MIQTIARLGVFFIKPFMTAFAFLLSPGFHRSGFIMLSGLADLFDGCLYLHGLLTYILQTTIIAVLLYLGLKSISNSAVLSFDILVLLSFLILIAYRPYTQFDVLSLKTA